MPHKSFVQPSLRSAELITFELGGELEEDGAGTWSEKFTALPTAPAGVTSDFIGSYVLDDQGRRIYQADAMVNYLRAALVPEDVPRFDALIRDPKRLLSTATIGDVVSWLAPLQSGFPT